MFTFSIVRRGSEERGIARDGFIIERIRKQRALSPNKHKNRIFIRDEKFPPS